jgi:4-hydroxy-tetrahydrodipicolinate synthase
MSQASFQGVLAPVLTPFRPDYEINSEAFLTHCRWLLDQGADGLAVFGTTSEANSLGLGERVDLLDFLVDNGISPALLMPGTGTCALTDTVRLTNHAVDHGCGGVLMLPPFYYKGVSDDGLFASYAEIIERVGSDALKIYLYHIPPIAQVGLSLDLIGRLLAKYPDTIVGIKDSSGDWTNTLSILNEYPNLTTFCGSERFLLDTLRNGGAGTITASGNVNPAGIKKVYQNWESAEADSLQAAVTELRVCFEGRPLVPALKAIAADFYSDPDWSIMRPPLKALGKTDASAIVKELAEMGFRMGDSDQDG